MSDFCRFPHTPHLAWLGSGQPRDDKVLSQKEADGLLAGEVVVEEKLDGANLGISVAPDGSLRLQNRGQYLSRPWSGQFSRLSSWLPSREEDLAEALGVNLILFGEWCTARHSLAYTTLPDWFLAFDVYDRNECRFWSTARRDELARKLNIITVPLISCGHNSVKKLSDLVSNTSSHFSSAHLEGIIIRQEESGWLKARAKLVHPDFTQAITEHWSRRGMEWNRVSSASNPSH